MVQRRRSGRDAYAWAFGQARMGMEQQLLDKIAEMEDAQCAFAMLVLSAVPRANHMLRNVQPS